MIETSKVLQETVLLLYYTQIRLGTLCGFLFCAMTAYAVMGMQLLKGLYHYCDDGEWAEDATYLATVGEFPDGGWKDGEVNNNGLYIQRPCSGAYMNTNGTTLEVMALLERGPV